MRGTVPCVRDVRRTVSRWVLFGALAIHLPIALVAGARSRVVVPGSDFDNYYEIGLRPGRPYVDFMVEFPVATVQAFRTIAPIAGRRETFGVTLVALNVAADLTIAAALWWGWGIEAAACYAVVAAPLLDLFLLRLDLWSTALATIGVAMWQRDRRHLAAIGFAAGAAFKLWPLAFLPLLLVPSRTRERTWLPIATAAAAGAVVFGVWLWVAGARGLYQVLTFRGAHGWEVESTVGGIWMMIDRSSARVETGAWRIGTTSGPISILLFVVGMLPCLWLVWRGGRTKHPGSGWAGGLSWLLACSALLSPQFASWLCPAAGVAWIDGDWGISVLTALAVFLSNLEYKAFAPLLRGAPHALALVTARNVELIVLAIVAARLIARAPLTPEASSPRPAPRPEQST